MKNKKAILRKYIRTLRRSVYLTKQYKSAYLITNNVLNLKHIYQAKNIAIFISSNNEIRTNLLINVLLSMKKHVYLPMLPSCSYKSPYLLFARYTFSTSLIRNYLNTYEPKKNNTLSILPIEMLDIIFVPLVAFDQNGNRLGMGGGFYDKILQYHQNYHINCTSIGLGYDFQKVPQNFLPTEKWDMKLDITVTPSEIYQNNNTNN